MIRKLWLSLSLLFICVYLPAEIIDSVAIVRPRSGEKARETYNSVAKWLENSRNTSLADTFRLKSEDAGFGSGFLVEGGEDLLYMVTNFHVVSQTDMVSVEFQDHDGNATLLENCPVILADENRDLAVLLIDREAMDLELKGLSINGEMQVEGTDVWTAGFPGFGEDPLWQLAKGSVTNRRARTSELTVNGLDYVIQHSAIIDSGSSGGPLLLENPEEKGDYSVIGVNTWSARGRDNTYFSIPARDLIDFISEADQSLHPEQDNESLMIALVDAAEQFAIDYSSEEDDYQSHRRFLSHELILEKGWGSYQALRKTLSEAEKDDWDHYFFYISPFNAMKESVYTDMRKSFADEDDNRNIYILKHGEFVREKSSVTATVSYSVNDAEIESKWILEQGQWRISEIDVDISTLDNSDRDENKTTGLFRNISGESSVGIIPGLTLSYFNSSYYLMDDPTLSIGLDLDLEYYPMKFFGWKFGVGLNKYANLMFDMVGGVVLLLPFSLSEGDIYLTPRISATAGFALDTNSFSDFPIVLLPVNLTAGIEMSAGKMKEHLFWGIEFSYTQYFSLMSEVSDETMVSLKPSVYLRWFF